MDQISSKVRQPLNSTVSPTVFYRNILTDDVSRFAQALAKCLDTRSAAIG